MTKILAPCANAPLDRECDICKAAGMDKPLKAVADAKTIYWGWAYVCLTHLQTKCTQNIGLMTNITGEDLELSWL